MVQQNLLDLLRGRDIPTTREPRKPRKPPPRGTGYFSVIDSHELSETELANSNMVIGGDGLLYQPTYEQQYDAASGGFVDVVSGFQLAPKWLHEEILGFGDVPGGTGRTGPTAAELAIQRSQVQAQNLSTFIQGTIAELSAEIDAGRLEMDQALNEFNRKLDAFSEAGQQFQGIQPYTIPIGAEYAPGFQPGGIGEQLGIEPRRAEVIQYDPFSMANEIVAGTPVLTEPGVPSSDALSRAVELARSFVGG